MKTKEDVLNWFGDRGVFMDPKCLKKWQWADGTLWFVIKGSSRLHGHDTDAGCADMTKTHREDGSPILSYELYDTVPIAQSPFAKPLA